MGIVGDFGAVRESSESELWVALPGPTVRESAGEFTELGVVGRLDTLVIIGELADALGPWVVGDLFSAAVCTPVLDLYRGGLPGCFFPV